MSKFSLEDIFSDPKFLEMVKDIPERQVKHTDPEIERFQEITNWVQNNDGREPTKSRDLIERKFYARLKRYRNNPEIRQKLANFDKFDLLEKRVRECETTEKNVKSLDDILDDDTLFEKENDISSLLDLSRYKRTISTVDKNSVRKRMNNFEEYEAIFELTQREIANGTRKIVPVDSENNIKPGKFYIDNGILLYVKSVSEYYTDKHGYRNARLHLIYENGTENKKILLRSFASNLFDKKRHGRMVTEVMSDVMGETTIKERSAEYISTGYIYVVKSLSQHPEISKYNNLYKIGFSTGNVEKRIANSENEATYLYDQVKIIAVWEVQNLSARKLEKAIHNRFADKQLLISIPTANGRLDNPREWYIVSLEEIESSINDIITRLNI